MISIEGLKSFTFSFPDWKTSIKGNLYLISMVSISNTRPQVMVLGNGVPKV